MKTSNFWDHKGPGAIRISRGHPRGFPKMPTYKALAPGPWFKEKDRKRYEILFAVQLAGLDPQDVWEALHELTDPHEPILQCFENLSKPGNWCHRRLVAAWFESKLDVKIPELT